MKEEHFHKYWYPLGQRKVILHDSIMTFVSVIPAMVHQNLDSIGKTKPQGFQPYLNWSSYGGIMGTQFSKYLHYAHGMVLHDLPGGQYMYYADSHKKRIKADIFQKKYLFLVGLKK